MPVKKSRQSGRGPTMDDAKKFAKKAATTTAAITASILLPMLAEKYGTRAVRHYNHNQLMKRIRENAR